MLVTYHFCDIHFQKVHCFQKKKKKKARELDPSVVSFQPGLALIKWVLESMRPLSCFRLDTLTFVFFFWETWTLACTPELFDWLKNLHGVQNACTITEICRRSTLIYTHNCISIIDTCLCTIIIQGCGTELHANYTDDWFCINCGDKNESADDKIFSLPGYEQLWTEK